MSMPINLGGANSIFKEANGQESQQQHQEPDHEKAEIGTESLLAGEEQDNAADGQTGV